MSSSTSTIFTTPSLTPSAPGRAADAEPSSPAAPVVDESSSETPTDNPKARVSHGLDGAPAARTRRSFHIPALDGIRGVAILLVMVFHFSEIAHNSQSTGIRSIVQRIAGAGWVGVDLFFALSGFLITSILVEALGSSGYFKNFYMRRVLRIFPLYYGVLILSFVLWPLFGLPTSPTITSHQWALWAYLQNFVRINWFAFSHFWSLAVEEHFYLVWPAVMFLFGRRGAMGVALALIATAVSVRCYRTIHLHADVQETYIWTICRMDSLAIGALLALMIDGVATRLADYKRPASVVVLACAGLCVAMAVRNGSFAYTHPDVATVAFTLVALGSAGLISLAVATRPDTLLGRLTASTFLRFCGKYSYGIYVFHHFVHYAMRGALLGWGYDIHKLQGSEFWLSYLAYLLAGFGLSIAVALMSWHLYEKHFLKLKRYFEYRANTLEGFRPNEPVAATSV